MSVSLVLTVIGPDRPGRVEALSQLVADHEGNWLESRMARLAGQFSGILRVSVPENRVDALAEALRSLESEGLRVIVERSETAHRAVELRKLRLEIVGNDHPGIIRDIATALADRGVNVGELCSDLESAPMSGQRLFRATAALEVPGELDLEKLRKSLEALASDLMVDLFLERA